MRRRRDDAAKKKKTKSNNVVENELRALKRKYYPGDGTSLQNGDVSLKSIADKKTKGKFKRAQELDEEAAMEKARRERYAMMMASSGALEAEDGEETWRFQQAAIIEHVDMNCLLYTSPSPRDQRGSRMPSSA